jgi:hypothetical protein
MTPEKAVLFARKHIDTWNSHELEAILDLYAEDAELVSPLAANLQGNATVRGRAALRAYFAAGLGKYPDLQFELLDTFLSESSITLLMRGAARHLVAEVLFLDAAAKITKVYAHYHCPA